MKGIVWHLDNVRSKPHHVRRQVAFSAAGALTAVIALGWLSLSLFTGAFALKPTNFAELTGADTGTDTAEVAGEGVGDTTGVAGAAAAPATTKGPARVEVVPHEDSPVTSVNPGAKNAETIIPF